jgi:predicted phage terminase large subunit-like protein
MAHQFGTTVKATLEENERHLVTFPSKDARPDPERGWSTDGLYLQGTPSSSKDPAYRAIGFGAATLGARAHGIILDDPMTQEQAQSETEQVRAKAYHDMTIDTRLHPDGWEIAIMTRWHEQDLAAHLMAKDEWDTVLMPAIGYWGDGEALWPERFPLAWLEAKRLGLDGGQFDAVYQGDPTSLGGSVFKSANWFRPLPDGFAEIRRTLHVVQFWDLAWSSKMTADYTASVTVGIDKVGNLYILHAWRKRIDEEELPKELADLIVTTRPSIVGIEDGAFQAAATKDLILSINRDLTMRRVAIPANGVKVDRDKITRARLPAGRAQLGMVYADRNAPWYPEFEAECLGFPLKAHDDQVDALSGAARLAIESQPMLEKSKPVSYAMRAPTKPKGFDWQNAGSIFVTTDGKQHQRVNGNGGNGNGRH